jgi:class 3 adenylate cyclase/pimeloyl-ACP methyl ester carboxylesterase
MEPQIRYCTTKDGIRIAYAVAGAGPPLVYLPPTASHVALEWRVPTLRRRYEWLARRHTLIRFDAPGTGLSQRTGFESDDERDIETIADVLELEQFALFAEAMSGPRGIAYAAHHTERVARLVLWNTKASAPADPSVDALMTLAAKDWRTFSETFASIIGGWEHAAEARSYAALFREAVTAEEFSRARAAWLQADVTDLLPRVAAPTLVVHVQGGFFPIEGAQTLLAGIPNAQLQIVEGASMFSTFDTPDIAPWLESFLADGAIPDSPAATIDPRAPVSGVRTVVFTDIVGHTEMMQRLGDAKGRDVLREHERITRDTLRQHGGAEVKTMGDGFMASFASVTSALDCAIALQRAFAEHTESMAEPLHVRVGLNAGEPIEEEGDLFGATVILASRIAAKAGAGEILVPETVRGLLSGKNFVFSDRGEFVPKGFDDAVRLYEVRWRD